MAVVMALASRGMREMSIVLEDDEEARPRSKKGIREITQLPRHIPSHLSGRVGPRAEPTKARRKNPGPTPSRRAKKSGPSPTHHAKSPSGLRTVLFLKL